MANKNFNKSETSNQRGWIVLVGGGSGGHVLPLKSIAKSLLSKSDANRILIVTDRNYFERVVSVFEDLAGQYQGRLVIKRISSGKFRRYSRTKLRELVDVKTQLLNIRDIFKVALGFIEAKLILLRYDPGVIFCKGGNSALEFCLAARKKAPIVVHDSDSRPGMANRIVGRYAEVFLKGMPESSSAEDVEAMVGIPVDEGFKVVTLQEKKDLREKLGLDRDAKTVLVTGGGLGSQKLNELVFSILKDLNKLGIQVLHQTGNEEATNRAKVLRKELRSPKLYLPFGFSSNMSELYDTADIVISRAGATTIQELANSAKASIVIPAQLSDQRKNGLILDQLGASVVMDHDSLVAKPEELISSIQFLLSDEKFRDSIERGISQLARREVSDKIVETLLKLKNKNANQETES